MSLLAAAFPTEFVLPIVASMLAVYLLLPRPQPYPRLLGIAAGLTALVLAGMSLASDAAHGPIVESVLFYTFSALALIGGLMLVTQTNPARGAVSFALVVLSTCGLFLLQAAPFLMAGTVIIYAGAIVVTFLFVIMLSQQHGLSNADGRSREPFLACLVGGLLLAVLLFVLHEQYGDTGLKQLLTAVAQTQASAKSGKVDLDPLKNAISQLGPTPGAMAISRRFEELESDLAKPNVRPDDVAVMLASFRTSVVSQQGHMGDLLPRDKVVLSPFAGPPANRAHDNRLPAGNVVALGRTLFSDYLLGIEMAGTLLLVATIGAIAITHRSLGRRVA